MTHDARPYLEAIEQELRASLAPTSQRASNLYGMMRYHLGWADAGFRANPSPRGKRIRPLLCLLACEAVSGEWRRALPAACALELVHNFSLIHDDIEDQSETRRHRPTVWALWGVAQALNTGDAMWAISHLCCHRLSDEGYPPDTVLRVVCTLDRTCLSLCTGQYLDLQFESLDSVSLADYEAMIEGKTAALISASLRIGALLGGANDEIVERFAQAGRELGLTFQVVDDILGIWGDSGVTGKSAATDIVSRKKTLPVLYAQTWETERGHDDLASLYAAGEILPEDVDRVLALLDRAGAREYAQRRAREHLSRALTHLHVTQIGRPAMRALERMARDLLTRTS